MGIWDVGWDGYLGCRVGRYAEDLGWERLQVGRRVG